MPTSSADIGVMSSNYQGNAGLGGGSFGSFQLDTRPIQELAKYTMLYNKSEYDQRQKDAEAAAKEIADYTSYDLTTSIPKDAKLLQEKYDKVTAYAREHPDAINYRNKEEWEKFKVMRNDLENDLQGAKVRNLMYKAREEKIANEPDAAKKKLMLDELNAEIEATDIRTPIKHDQQYAVPDIKLPDAQAVSFDVVKQGANENVTREFKLFNVPKANADANVFTLGLENIETMDPNSPEGKRAAIDRKKNFWVQGAEVLNSVINNPSMRKEVDLPDGSKGMVIDESKLDKTSRGIVNLVKEYNNYVTQTKADIKSGVYKDKFNKPITFGPGALDENDYAEIDYKDGITSDELGKIAIFSKWNGDVHKTQIQQTDNALQATQQAETARHNKATEGIGWANVNLEKDKWNAAMKGDETVKNGAILFSERVYEDLKKLANEDGVIPPDKVRQLNQEQLKYLGIEKVISNEQGTASPKSVFSPLTVTDTDAIQLENGQIKVLSNAKLAENGSGRYVGTWDNTRSTTIYNIATNRLNEELQKAGAKELNSYLPLDIGAGGISVNTIGGGTSVSGSSTDKSAIKTTRKGLPVFQN